MSFSSRFKLENCFSELGRPIDVSSLGKRIRFQKIVYFLQEFGVDLGYRFNWYIHGPYSTRLADDGFVLSSLQNAERKRMTEDVSVKAFSKDLKKSEAFLTKLSQVLPEISEESRLELAASLHFMAKYTYMTTNQDSIVGAVLSQKNHFKRKQAETAWLLLSEFKLV